MNSITQPTNPCPAMTDALPCLLVQAIRGKCRKSGKVSKNGKDVSNAIQYPEVVVPGKVM
jgi:hypothetical protein